MDKLDKFLVKRKNKTKSSFIRVYIMVSYRCMERIHTLKIPHEREICVFVIFFTLSVDSHEMRQTSPTDFPWSVGHYFYRSI